MNRNVRITLFLITAAALAGILVLALMRLPGPERVRSRYADAANTLAVPLRNVTNVVAAVNFDFRAFDTLGEEFILFVSVMGVLVLLREVRPINNAPLLRDAATSGRDVRMSDAVRAFVLLMVAPKVLFGLYIIAHGALTPGGGFQGGVILATVPLIIYLSTDFKSFQRIVRFHLTEIAEAAGVLALISIGLAGLFSAHEFLSNVFGLGTSGQITAGGSIALFNLGTGLEVAAAFVLLLYAFLQDTLVPTEFDK